MKQPLNMQGIKGQQLEDPQRLDQEWKGEQRQQGRGTMASGQQEPVENHHYDLISVMYHALQAVETYQKYCDDAEQAGDKDLQNFFDECIEQNRKSAMRAQELLFQRSQQALGGQQQQQKQAQASDGASRH